MSSDTIRMLCPNLKCRTILVAPAHARGKAVRCRQCGIKVRVPDASAVREPQREVATEAVSPTATPATPAAGPPG